MSVDRRKKSPSSETRALQVFEVRKMNTDRQSRWKGASVLKKGRKSALLSALEADSKGGLRREK